MMPQIRQLLESVPIRPNRTQLLRFGLSFALAVLLWGWVTQLQDPFTEEQFLEIPIEMPELPDNLQIVTTLPTVTVKIQGAESRVSPVNRSDITAFIDSSEIREPGTYQVEIVAEAPGISSISVEPEELTIQVDQRISQVFPLTPTEAEPEGDSRSTIQGTEPSVTQVTVTGPQSALERVATVILPITIDQQTQDFDAAFEPQALDANGQRIAEVEILPNLILTHVTVETRGKQVAVIPAVTGVPAEGFTIQQRRAIPDTIIVDGPPEVLDDLLFINTDPVDVSDATESISTRVGLADLPDGVTVVEPPDGTVEVRVAIEDTTSSSQPLSDLPVQVVGIGDGLVARVEPDAVSIQVSAPIGILQSMRPEDIGVYVDVTGLGPGTYQLTPVVTVPQGAMWIGSEPGTVRVTIVDATTASPVSDSPPSSPETG
jgi:YbbR domain-containing protein